MKYPGTVKIGKAANAYSKFDLVKDVLTTTDIGELNLVNSIECLLGDKFNVDIQQFARVAPLVYPFFGTVRQRLISVFVPYYLIADDADAYISGLKYFAGESAKPRYFRQYMLDQLFYDKSYSGNPSGESLYMLPLSANEVTEILKLEDLPLWVYTVVKSDGTKKYFKFNRKGKSLYKIFRSLGYDINRVVDFSATRPEGQNAINSQDKLNAYPILCYMKAYADLILPSAFYQTSNLLAFLHKCKLGDTYACSAVGLINMINFSTAISQCLRVYYDSDYFTSAWQSPNSPLSTLSPTAIEHYNDATNDVELTSDKSSNALVLSSTLSQTQLKFLRSFDNFVRRNNLVGFREFNAVYSRFGIKPSEMKSNYCQIIDLSNSPLNVGDVTSTAQTDDTALGSYAGKGFQNHRSKIEFEANDYGLFLQIAWITVTPIYFQGLSKQVLRIEPLDFYQPEFDGVGPAAISKREINSQVKNEVFGYTERYNDYRFSQSQILGDFATDELMLPWHTGRVFGKSFIPSAQSDNMISYTHDSAGNTQYNRLFVTENMFEGNVYDHFYQTWTFNISALRQMKNFNEALDLGVGNIQLDRNGSV